MSGIEVEMFVGTRWPFIPSYNDIINEQFVACCTCTVHATATTTR